MKNKRIIFIISGIVFFVVMCIGVFLLIRFVTDGINSPEEIRQNNGTNNPSASIDPLHIDSLENISVYKQEYSMDYQRDNLVTILDNPEQLNQWRTTLATCTPHKPNHPKYDEVYLAVISHAEGEYTYQLRVDSDDDNNIDLVPFETGEAFGNVARFEKGIYRCEGLQNFINDFPKQ